MIDEISDGRDREVEHLYEEVERLREDKKALRVVAVSARQMAVAAALNENDVRRRAQWQRVESALYQVLEATK